MEHSTNEIVELIKKSDSDITAALINYTTEQLSEFAARFEGPIKLNWSHRIMAKALGIDVSREQTRLLAIINTAIGNRTQ
jgi:hypothetical protein